MTQANDNEDNKNIRSGEGAHTAELWAGTSRVCSRDKALRGSSLQSGRQFAAASGKVKRATGGERKEY